MRISGSILRRLVLTACLVAALIQNAVAAPVITANDPTAFFTNVASRLLAKLNVDASHIQVCPTNEYTPAVHRLLQLTANLYDATTTNSYPTIFRPTFTGDGTNLFISGYAQLDSTNLSALTMPISISDAAALIGSNLTVNVYGIPWILGAKKGLPNFNEVTLENIFLYARKLQVVRVVPGIAQEQVNQMLVLNVSNAFGIELWNSYQTNYPGNVSIQADASVSFVLTNDLGVSASNTLVFSRGYPLTTNWVGRGSFGFPVAKAFQIPFATNVAFVPLSAFRQNPPGLVATTNSFETGTGFPNPHWGLATIANIRCAIVDAGPPARVIDYVQLNGPTAFLDLNATIQTPDNAYGFYGLWSTNIVTSVFLPTPAPVGVVNQLEIGLGVIPDIPSIWPADTAEIQAFRSFYYSLSSVGAYLCPYTPASTVHQTISWQVNDPLSHYIAADFSTGFSSLASGVSLSAGSTLRNIGQLNQFFRPWGGNPYNGSTNDFDLSIKDPLVTSSDAWDFPTNGILDFSSLGRVHRGTPWQTLYLKSDVADPAAWQQWTGLDPAQAALTHPTNDWQIAADLAMWLNTNALTSLFSINSDTAGWQSRLDGLTAVTNSATKVYDPIVIASNSPQAAIVANAVADAKAMHPGGFFGTVADVLAVPELSLASPWLNLGSNQILYGINDAAYEMVPSQLLPLLRADSVGAIDSNPANLHITFTGYDSQAYVVQASANLLDWVNVSTNYPVNGTFSISNAVPPDATSMFYRSVLLSP